MARQIIILLLAVFLTTAYGRSAISSDLPLDLSGIENVHYDGGVPWMLIPDDEGVLHIAILKEISPPQPINVATDVRLNLYTRSNRNTPYRLLVNNNANLANSAFNPAHPTKILIHGFGGNGNNRLIISGKNAYLDRGNYNVIGVDWGVLAASPNYAAAAANTRVTGAHVADLIEFLVRQAGARLQDFHLIGHSLGGHVSGFAGKNIRTGRVARITGLDSANPSFANQPPSGRLFSGDATVVDAIHTNSGGLGLRDPYGDVSFYPNRGGVPQPGCGLFDLTGACAHSRCVDFFLFSINQRNAFPSVECLTLNQALNGACTGSGRAFMGDDLRFDRFGIYFLDTRGVPALQ